MAALPRISLAVVILAILAFPFWIVFEFVRKLVLAIEAIVRKLCI